MESVTINGLSDSNVKIRLIGHCIICLKKVSTGLEEEGTTEKCKEQAYPEAAPKSLVSTPGFLATFQEIWGILQNGSEESNGGGAVNGKRKRRKKTSFGISLEKVVVAAGGSHINVSFSRTPSPTICYQCYTKILAVENMMKVIRHQVRVIKRIVEESRKGGKFAGGRAEQIQKTLQVFTLEVDDRGSGSDGHLNLVDEIESEEKFVEEEPKPRRGRPPKPKQTTISEDDSMDSVDQDDNSLDFEVDKFVEEKPKPRRGRPPKPKPVSPISDDSMDSGDHQEGNSMDCHGDDRLTNKSEDKEDPDFQIKTEPQDSDEDDGGDDDDDDDGSNYSDEFLAGGSSKKSLRSLRAGRKSSSVTATPTSTKKDDGQKGHTFLAGSIEKIRWQTIEMSDEEIARDWRVKDKTRQKNGYLLGYYCAYGRTCRRKIKKKILKDGTFTVTTNGLEHCNHRDKNFGLTKEQIEFIKGCLDVGVGGPNNILVSFKAKGVPVPTRKQVFRYVDRCKRQEKAKVGVGGNKVDGQKKKEGKS